MKRWLILLITAGSLLVPAFGSEASYNMPEISAFINSLKTPVPPQPLGESLLFTYKPDYNVRMVGIAFGHENYRTIYPFLKTRSGLYVLLHPIPVEMQDIEYRIIQDGLWLKDPANPDQITKSNGVIVSHYSLPHGFLQQERETQVNDNRARFRFSGIPGKQIYVTGSFNNWDPFIHKMVETSPGEYSLTITVPPGNHYYYFLQNGLKLMDDTNPKKATTRDGDWVNVIASR